MVQPPHQGTDLRRALGVPLYAQILAQFKVSPQDLEAALNDPAAEARIRQDMDSGERSGVDGTPAFFINGTKFAPRGGFGDVFTEVQRLLGAR